MAKRPNKLKMSRQGYIQLPLWPNDVSDIRGFGAYQIVDTEQALDQLLEYLRGAQGLAVDTETTGTNAMIDKLVGISLSREPGTAFYLPVGHSTLIHLGQQLSLELVQARLGPVLASEGIGKVGHNIKFDMKILERHGLPLGGPVFDTMIAAWLVESVAHHLGLKDQALRRLGCTMTSIDELLGPGYGMDLISTTRVARYACADVDMTLRLMQALQPLVEQEPERRLFNEIEMPLIQVLKRMETYGMIIDQPYLRTMGVELRQELKNTEEQIHQIAGHKFNINSPVQLGKVLFGELGLSGYRGDFSTSIRVLTFLKGKHSIIGPILEQRQLSKLMTTYIDALPLLVNPSTGRVHTSLNQTGTRTGRLSSSHPNLQQVPTRTDLGRRIRGAFIAPEGHVLLSCDYTQIEPRILAHITQDPKLLAAFAAGVDVHTSTASELFNIPLKEVTYAQRTLAKRIYFGLMYGISEQGLAERTERSVQEARQFIEAYFSRFVRVRDYFRNTVQYARAHGYVQTLLGRKRYFPELLPSSNTPPGLRRSAERAAINMPIQGMAADIMKIAMITVDRELQRSGLHSRMVLQVHDELLLEVPVDEVEATTKLVSEAMVSPYKLDAPLKVHAATGRSWLDAM